MSARRGARGGDAGSSAAGGAAAAAGTSSSAAGAAAEHSDPNILSVLVATDCHLGYCERDPVRGSDSLRTFEEILVTAKERKVDMVLLGGDLFHYNKPSRKTLHDTMMLLRQYCMGDNPVQFQILSDQSVNFPNSWSGCVNYEDPNYNVAIPVFSIHGNHDDPSGVNYFGQVPEVDAIELAPILIQKGRTRVALYGLGSMKDERLYNTFVERKVNLMRPVEDTDDWFNVFVFHQNRAVHGVRNHIPEKFLPSFLDLVVWGHEHECKIEPEVVTSSGGRDIRITQPGSSIATSLSPGEAERKHVAIVHIRGREFKMEKIELKTVRPFEIRDIVLQDEPEVTPEDTKGVEAFLAGQVEELLKKCDQEHAARPGATKKRTPLIRLRVEYSGGFQSFNAQRFGQQFVDRVANPKDLLHFYRKKTASAPAKKPSGLSVESVPERPRPDQLSATRVEDLVHEFLEEEEMQMEVLKLDFLDRAVQKFVEKEDKDAIRQFVTLHLDMTRKKLKAGQADLSAGAAAGDGSAGAAAAAAAATAPSVAASTAAAKKKKKAAAPARMQDNNDDDDEDVELIEDDDDDDDDDLMRAPASKARASSSRASRTSSAAPASRQRGKAARGSAKSAAADSNDLGDSDSDWGAPKASSRKRAAAARGRKAAKAMVDSDEDDEAEDDVAAGGKSDSGDDAVVIDSDDDEDEYVPASDLEAASVASSRSRRSTSARGGARGKTAAAKTKSTAAKGKAKTTTAAAAATKPGRKATASRKSAVAKQGGGGAGGGSVGGDSPSGSPAPTPTPRTRKRLEDISSDDEGGGAPSFNPLRKRGRRK